MKNSITQAHRQAQENKTRISTITIDIPEEIQSIEQVKDNIKKIETDEIFIMADLPLKEKDGSITYKKIIMSGKIPLTIEYSTDFIRVYIRSDISVQKYSQVLNPIKDLKESS